MKITKTVCAMKEVNYNIQECANELIKLRAEQCRHAKVMDNFWAKIDSRNHKLIKTNKYGTNQKTV